MTKIDYHETNIRLTKNQWQKIRQIAFDHEISISEAMRKIIGDDWWIKERNKLFGPLGKTTIISTKVQSVPFKRN